MLQGSLFFYVCLSALSFEDNTKYLMKKNSPYDLVLNACISFLIYIVFVNWLTWLFHWKLLVVLNDKHH